MWLTQGVCPLLTADLLRPEEGLAAGQGSFAALHLHRIGVGWGACIDTYVKLSGGRCAAAGRGAGHYRTWHVAAAALAAADGLLMG